MKYCTDGWITSYLQNIGLHNMLLSVRFITPAWFSDWLILAVMSCVLSHMGVTERCVWPGAFSSCTPTSSFLGVMLIKCLVTCYQSFVQYLSVKKTYINNLYKCATTKLFNIDLQYINLCVSKCIFSYTCIAFLYSIAFYYFLHLHWLIFKCVNWFLMY